MTAIFGRSKPGPPGRLIGNKKEMPTNNYSMDAEHRNYFGYYAQIMGDVYPSLLSFIVPRKNFGQQETLIKKLGGQVIRKTEPLHHPEKWQQIEKIFAENKRVSPE